MLIDPFGRPIHYLRVSVTDRCDLRCFYCLPKGAAPSLGRGQRLAPAEIEPIVDFCGAHGFILPLIETMPVGEAGRRALDHYLPLDEVERRLAERHTLIVEDAPADGPARYLMFWGGAGAMAVSGEDPPLIFVDPRSGPRLRPDAPQGRTRPALQPPLPEDHSHSGADPTATVPAARRSPPIDWAA